MLGQHNMRYLFELVWIEDIPLDILPPPVAFFELGNPQFGQGRMPGEVLRFFRLCLMKCKSVESAGLSTYDI